LIMAIAISPTAIAFKTRLMALKTQPIDFRTRKVVL
jgi:hypothetical protein